MPISYKHKCIFVHIPRTGGSTILNHLKIKKSPHNLWSDEFVLVKVKGTVINTSHLKNFSRLQHVSAETIKKLRPDIFDEYYKFSVIRNPYTKMVSEYAWRKKMKEEFYSYSNDMHKFHFESYLSDVESKKILTIRESSQYAYLHNENGKLLVDDIIRFENIEEDSKKVFNKLNISCEEISHLNRTKLSFDKDYLLDDKNKQRIYNLYKIDFETFGYEK